MNKNLTIGLLVVLLVLAGGYFLLRGNPNTTTNLYTTNTTNNPVSTTPTTPVTSVPPLTLSTPTVETSSTALTSISTALVTGQVNPNGLSTTYWFEYGATTSLGSKTAIQQIGSGFSAISSPLYINGLQASSIYYFRLSASNNLGTVNGVTYSFQTNNNPPVKVSLPTVHTNNASVIMRTSATLNGQVNPNGWQTNYWFEYGKDNNLGNTTSITSVPANTSLSNVTASLSLFSPLTKYYFRLNAQNQFGTVNGTILSFTTQGPSNPGVPAVTTNNASSITNGSAQLNGHVSPNGADTTYWFEYSNNSLLSVLLGGGTPIQTISAGTNTMTVKGSLTSLSKKTKYYYRLVGRNQYGTIYGSIDSFTTKP